MAAISLAQRLERLRARALAYADFSFSPVIFAVKRKTSRHAHAMDPCTLVCPWKVPITRGLLHGFWHLEQRRLVRHGNRPRREPATFSLSARLLLILIESKRDNQRAPSFQPCQRLGLSNRCNDVAVENHERKFTAVFEGRKKRARRAKEIIRVGAPTWREREKRCTAGEKCALVSA